MKYLNATKIEFNIKHSIWKLVVFCPFIVYLISYLLSGGAQIFTIYWWFYIFIPFIIPVFAGNMDKFEKKSTKYHTFFSSDLPLEKIWNSRIIFLTLLFFLSNLFICGFVFIGPYWYFQKTSFTPSLSEILLAIF